MDQKHSKHLCATLSRARTAGRPALLEESDIPESVSDAYAISFAQMQKISAWKVGGANPWSRKVFRNTNSFIGPLRPDELFLGTSSIPVAHLNAPLAEPEIMLEIAPSNNTADVQFSRMSIGFEIPATVLPEALKANLNGQIVDRAGAGALWIDGITPFDQTALKQEFSCRTWHNGAETPPGSSTNLTNGPLGAAFEFLQVATAFGAPLLPGQWVATGGLSPAFPVATGDFLRVKALDWDVGLNLI
ncbi:hypothetical protein [Ruegeria sp. HKCCA5426]|uniref:hypothetical protein n=1 Tax=Ruegeria sp. HKCCA5426 TaxID=2682985 RepID=UPI001C2B7F84|nr:hypothetical protein [Ruegeria sp. HKCCA5426]